MGNRRNFLKNLGAASIASTLPLSQVSAKTSVKDKDVVKVGLIGVRGMGWADLNSFLKNEGTVCVALCDVDAELLKRRADELETKTGRRPKTFSDHRELLKLKEIAGVIIGTPDHWHCIQMTDACAAACHDGCRLFPVHVSTLPEGDADPHVGPMIRRDRNERAIQDGRSWSSGDLG